MTLEYIWNLVLSTAYAGVYYKVFGPWLVAFLGGCAYAIDLSGLGDDGLTDRLASYIHFSSIARPREYTLSLLLGALWQCINPSDWFNGLCLI